MVEQTPKNMQIPSKQSPAAFFSSLSNDLNSIVEQKSKRYSFNFYTHQPLEQIAIPEPRDTLADSTVADASVEAKNASVNMTKSNSDKNNSFQENLADLRS